MARMRAPDRRRQLLEVATRLFAERGYRGTTTAQLAAEAGVTEPVLYRHFENKLALFCTLVDDVGREVIESWQRALEGVTDPAARLRIILEGNPATHARGRDAYRVIFQALSEGRQEPAITSALRRHVSRLHRFLEHEIDSLQTERVVRRDEPAAALAWLLVHAAVGYGMLTPLGLPRRPAERVRHGMHRLIEALVRRTRSDRS